VRQAAGFRVTSVVVKTRRCVDVSYSTCWGFRRWCRVAPTSAGFDYRAKAGTQVRVTEGGGYVP